jgi:hypothetical protein
MAQPDRADVLDVLVSTPLFLAGAVLFLAGVSVPVGVLLLLASVAFSLRIGRRHLRRRRNVAGQRNAEPSSEATQQDFRADAIDSFLATLGFLLAVILLVPDNSVFWGCVAAVVWLTCSVRLARRLRGRHRERSRLAGGSR